MLEEDHPCKRCTKCCEHIALPIPTPKNKDDWNNILWYIIHKNVIVFTDDECDWFIEFKTPCKELDNSGLCKIYSSRPIVCKEYSSDSCEMHGDGDYFNLIFKKKEDVIQYVKKHTKFKEFPN